MFVLNVVRHVYASRTRFIPEGLLGLFDKTSWPPVVAGTQARAASQGVRLNVSARMRGMCVAVKENAKPLLKRAQ